MFCSHFLFFSDCVLEKVYVLFPTEHVALSGILVMEFSNEKVEYGSNLW